MKLAQTDSEDTRVDAMEEYGTLCKDQTYKY